MDKLILGDTIVEAWSQEKIGSLCNNTQPLKCVGMQSVDGKYILGATDIINCMPQITLQDIRKAVEVNPKLGEDPWTATMCMLARHETEEPEELYINT